jgi:HEPN domain-containing protein
MTPTEKRLRLARAWLDKARGDLEAARAIRDVRTVPGWILGFHLQQAAEKAWKGRLVLCGTMPPGVHDLARILEMRTGQASPTEQIKALIASLQPFAVEDRYPLLTPREMPCHEIAILLPQVEAEVEALADELASDGA